MQHASEMSETVETYICNIGGREREREPSTGSAMATRVKVPSLVLAN
jgi:hypothetical protein